MVGDSDQVKTSGTGARTLRASGGFSAGLAFLRGATGGEAFEIGQRCSVDPGAALAGVVARAEFELLKEPDQAGSTEAFAEGRQAFAADVVKRLVHRIVP